MVLPVVLRSADQTNGRRWPGGMQENAISSLSVFDRVPRLLRYASLLPLKVVCSRPGSIRTPPFAS